MRWRNLVTVSLALADQASTIGWTWYEQNIDKIMREQQRGYMIMGEKIISEVPILVSHPQGFLQFSVVLT